MALEDIVKVTISKASASVSRAGFGTPLIAAYHTNWNDRVKTYNAGSMLTSLTNEGFATDDPAYLAAQAILSQNPRPSKIKIGRRDNVWTQTVTITPTAQNNTDYKITIGGEEATFTSGGSATAATISAGLTTAINGLSVAVTAVDQTGTIDVTADSGGDLFDYEGYDRSLLQVVDTTTDAGIATDLNTIRAADADWYGLVIDSGADAENEAAAAWAETQQVIFGASGYSSDIVGSGSGDSFSTMEASAYARTFGIWHPQATEYPAAAWLGEMLWRDPGSATWAYKTLNGVPATDISPTEITQLEGKDGNYYKEIAGVNVTIDGISFSGEFIDVTRGIDWLQARLEERLYALLVSSAKIPYTDTGVDLIRAEILAQLQQGIDRGLLAATPEPTVTAPDVADVSSVDKSARVLPDVEFSATLAGAIHTIQIDGTVSV